MTHPGEGNIYLNPSRGKDQEQENQIDVMKSEPYAKRIVGESEGG